MRIVFSLLLATTLFSCADSKKKEEAKISKLCECVIQGTDKLSEECKTLKREWEEEFNAADQMKKEKMTKELTECSKFK